MSRKNEMTVTLRDYMSQNGDNEHRLEIAVSNANIEISPRLGNGREMTVAVEVWDNEFRVLVWNEEAHRKNLGPQIIKVGPMMPF